MDTNIFFGAAYPLDRLNTWSEKFVELCCIHEIPLYINLNIRSEFMDLYRRVLVVESLLMIRSVYGSHLTLELEKWLKALSEKVRAGIANNRSVQIDERTLKEYRKALIQLVPDLSNTGKDLWELLCRDYLQPQLQPVWDEACDSLGINFAGSRITDSPELFSKSLNWNEATKIMGLSALGSTDAMILNFFACSKFSVLVTGDIQVAEHAVKMDLEERVIVLAQDDEIDEIRAIQ